MIALGIMAILARHSLSIAAFAFAIVGDASAADAGSGYAARPEVREFVTALAEEHRFNAPELMRLFSQVQTQNSALNAMNKPYATPPKWFEYSPPFVATARVDGGVAYWNANRRALERAEREYGVPAEIVVAIVGVETFYGRISGKYRVIDALTTLAFDYPRRAEFFREELKQFLLLTRELKIPPLSAKGSFAGAMGVPQFMPTSFRRFGVDFDGDGKIDLWSDNDDVIGSVANFLQLHGWQRGAPILFSADVDPSGAQNLMGDNGLSPMREYGEWAAQNVTARTRSEIDPHAPAMLVQLDERDGPAYRLGFTNFHVLRQYNRSRLYASAVWELAQAIRKARAAQ
ncbi:MAG: lytic murein transglycosylase B [Betaproteobacteria bacterium]